MVNSLNRHIFIKVTLILALSLYHTLYWTFNFVGGIFAGCEGNETPDHAVAVVGYGTYNGVDYWLIKVKSCNLQYGSIQFEKLSTRWGTRINQIPHDSLNCCVFINPTVQTIKRRIFNLSCTLKNSWGTDKGYNGFYYLQRGVKMCGIGKFLVTLGCGQVSYKTDVVFFM